MPLTHDEHSEIRQVVYDMLVSHELLHPDERRGDRLEDALPPTERAKALSELAARQPNAPAVPSTDLLRMKAEMEQQFAAEMTALRERIDALMAAQHAAVASIPAPTAPGV